MQHYKSAIVDKPNKQEIHNRNNKMTTRYNDYSGNMPHLSFSYDEDFYPEDSDLPDPQQNPVLVGARKAIQKVGVGPIELPLKLKQRDGGVQEVYAKASLYGSLDDPNSKGLNFSRFYALMHESLDNHMSVDALKDVLKNMRDKQKCTSAYCKLRFNYRWVQSALRSREELPETASDDQVFKVVQGVKLSHEKKKSHIFYACELDGQMHNDEYKFYLTVDYRYGSTCPCSFHLAQHAMLTRGKAANGHSQRSTAKITIQLDPNNPMLIEDVVELARTQIPTEVQVFMKRRDEQAQAELSGSNTLFTEDASRLLYEGLDQWFDGGRILDFSVVTSHEESIHPYNALSIMYKGIENGLR